MKLLTRKQVLDLLQISPSTLCRLIASGSIPCVPIGTRTKKKKLVRFLESDLEKWIRSRQAEMHKPTRRGRKNSDSVTTGNGASQQVTDFQPENDGVHQSYSLAPGEKGGE